MLFYVNVGPTKVAVYTHENDNDFIYTLATRRSDSRTNAKLVTNEHS